jgi:hydroxybutyrate-dimer hydrolase
MRSQALSAVLFLAFPALFACSSTDEPTSPTPAEGNLPEQPDPDGKADKTDPDQGLSNPLPSFIRGSVSRTDHDLTDDLLTAGLGQSGLANAVPPPVADPLAPTAGELRRLAIYSNYRAIVDVVPGGGYGELYGPAVGSTDSEGRIPGREYRAFADDGSGKQNVVLMVQVPASFDSARPCIVAAPSSGSRGIYGAIGSAGEWGLKKGCAVAYTDKGTGMGVHDLETNTVNDMQGVRVDAAVAGKDSHFTAIEGDEARSAFLAEAPHRVAFKHAHSAQNPEKSWGNHVLQSIELAFYVLNLEENFGSVAKDGRLTKTLLPENTIVIASSVSNGGGASIRAAEIDGGKLIDGVAVSEPNVNPPMNPGLKIRQGERVWDESAHSQPLLAYTTLLNLYAPCGILAPALQGAPFALTPANLGENRCAALFAKGLLQSDSVEEQALEALELLHDAGMLDEHDRLLPSHHALSVYESIGFTYASAYGRFGVTDALCGFSFAGLDPATYGPAPVPAQDLAQLFGTSNGVPPSGAVYLFNDDSLGGALLSRYSVSPSTQTQDQNLDGALCLRSLATGTGTALSNEMQAKAERVLQGMKEVRTTGKLRGVPTIIVHGRSDALLPVNYTSRAYYGVNKIQEDNESLRYYEVSHGQHLDVLNGFADFGALYIPLHHYFNQAMDLMWGHLTEGKALPDSQFVRTVPRGKNEAGAVLPISPAHLPSIATDPAPEDRVLFDGTTLVLPDTHGASTSAAPAPMMPSHAAKDFLRRRGFALP